MQPEYAFKIKLSQVMNTGFASIDAEEEIRAAAWKMMTLGFGELIVMQEGPIGIISERGLVHRARKIKGPEFLKDAIRPQNDTSHKHSW